MFVVPGGTSVGESGTSDQARSRKRGYRTLRWTEQVRVKWEVGLLHPDDGFRWRKYAKSRYLEPCIPVFREYFRCAQRHAAKCCFARKHVQRSSEDPSFLVVTYTEKHTCIGASFISSK